MHEQSKEEWDKTWSIWSLRSHLQAGDSCSFVLVSVGIELISFTFPDMVLYFLFIDNTLVF